MYHMWKEQILKTAIFSFILNVFKYYIKEIEHFR